LQKKGKSITIGIPTFNGAHRLNNCVESIKKWNDVPDGCKVDILILDDGSHEPKRSESFWVAAHHNIPIIPHKENMGISKSWNDLCQYGESDYIVLLNDDILVSKDWLTAGLYFLEHNDNVGAVGWDCYYVVDADIPVVLESSEPPEIWRDRNTKELQRTGKGAADPARSVPYYIMACAGYAFMFTRSNYEHVGGFDEGFRSFYEETDFGTRFAQAGMKSFMLHTPMLYHLWSATFADNQETLQPSRVMDESRRYYSKKWGGTPIEKHHEFMGPPVEIPSAWLEDGLSVHGIIREQ
jgi:GT2 family glycosyltransferase